MNNVNFVGFLEWSDTLQYIERANCVYGQIGNAFTSAIPSKLYEYLACGRPVVFGLPEGAARSFASKFEGIYLCTPNSSTHLRKTLLELKAEKKYDLVHAERNRAEVQRCHIREDQFSSFVQIIRSLTQKASKR